MKFTSITELVLRFPMILSGLLTLVLFPLAIRKQVNSKTTVIFAILIAMSPFMISYARIARPYAVTLLGVYLAFWCFERVFKGHQLLWRPASAYVLISGLVIWMHAITGPLLITPIIVLWWEKLHGRGKDWRDIILLTGSVGLVMALAVLPPILLDPGAIAGKSGIDSIKWKTVYGAMFFWFGTSSEVIMWLSMVFACFGLSKIWRVVPIVRFIIIGSALTALILLLSKPWWIDQPLALGRYLLPLVPVLLLAVAAGLVRVASFINYVLKTQAGQAEASYIWTFALVAPFLALSWHFSPLQEVLVKPNSFTQDSYFQLDYRKELNPIRVGTPYLPSSIFWTNISYLASDSVKVAVLPFRYSTYEWPAPLWERDSHQRVIPAYMWGSCELSRHGETPPDARFDFRNGVHVNNKQVMLSKQVDYLAYYVSKHGKGLSPPLPDCEAWVRAKYGKPDYEDSVLIVWRINSAAAPLSK